MIYFKRKHLILFIFPLFLTVTGNSQNNRGVVSYSPLNKPPIDLDAIKNWTYLGSEQISNDGRFISYSINNQPAKIRRLVVQSTITAWKREYLNATHESFSNDSRYFAFKTSGDSLVILTLGNGNKKIVADVKKFQFFNDKVFSWLIYTSSNQQNNLRIIKLPDGGEFTISSIESYQFTPGGNSIVLLQKDSTTNIISIKIFNLLTGSSNTLWANESTGYIPVSIAIDSRGQHLASILQRKGNNRTENSLWYCDLRSLSSRILLTDNKIALNFENLQLLTANPEFSVDGERIFFRLQLNENREPNPDAVELDVWNYQDSVLQSLQLLEVNNKMIFTAVINISDESVLLLEQGNERIVGKSNDFVLLEKRLGMYGMFESAWNASAQFSYYLVSLRDGTKRLLRDSIINPAGKLSLSPNGTWIIYYDFNKKNYFSYRTETGQTFNITNGCNNSWEDEKSGYPEPHLCGNPIWAANDNALFVYDNYDIWVLDPSGDSKPLNFTNKYGRKNNIKFTLFDDHSTVCSYSLKNGQIILLNAFNESNKDRGYFSKKVGYSGEPSLHCMGPYIYGNWDIDYTYNFPPKKAKNANVYLDFRSSSTEAPNYFVTRDYKTLNFITDINPQKKYNWYITELHNWKSLDGTILQGILYKPENFDTSKKYPVIFQFYERRSHELNLFIWPAMSKDQINIPTFVSRGYLVFVPDIHYDIGEPGESAYNSVVSAARYLLKFSWIDSAKLGLQGHSFGGFETSYILTHSNLFAAACSVSGIYDLISFYGSAARGGYPMYHAERNQGRLGSTLWQTPKLYIENSPIFGVDRITTPLLMMNNKEDGTVPFAQGVEFFTSLRRLGKKVWMLQYDHQGHSLNPFSNAAIDFHTRMTQFFDHYLKSAPAPYWMTRGIPAKMKGIENGFKLN